jgi:4-amino-4-deoxy-L-arabinose transferase-like glycosyltransferase
MNHIRRARSAFPLLTHHTVILTGILIIYFAFATYNLTLCGLYNDEAYRAELAMGFLKNEPVDVGVRQSITLLGRSLPVMPQEYIGALEVYLLLPVFAVFGVSVWSLRFASVLWGAISLTLFFCWTRKLFGKVVAGSAALLLATHPSFIFWHRMGCFASPEMLILVNGALLLLVRYYETLKKRFVYLAMLLIGIGIYAKMIFVWVFFALVSCYLGFRLIGDMDSPARRLRARDFGLSAIALLIGSAPVIWYNLKTGETVKLLAKSFVQPTMYGMQNFDIWQNLNTRISELLIMLDGSWFRFLGVAPHHGFFVKFFILSVFGSLVVILAVIVRKMQLLPKGKRRLLVLSRALRVHGTQRGNTQNGTREDDSRIIKGLLFCILMLAIMLVASIITVSSFGSQHLLILLPFCVLLCILFLRSLTTLVRTQNLWSKQHLHQAISLGGAVTTFLLIVGNLNIDTTYLRALNRTHGSGQFSGAIYELADYLEENGIARPIAVDWGFSSNLLLLTAGKVKPIEISGYTVVPGEAFIEACRKYFSIRGNVYLFHSPEFTAFKRLDTFKAVAEQMNKQVVLERTFEQRDGNPVIALYSVRDAVEMPTPQEAQTYECVDLLEGWSSSLRLEEGWYGFETYETGGWRWIDRKATVLLKSPLKLDQIEVEAFAVLEHFEQRRLRLEIFLDDTRIAERLISVEGPTHVVVEVPGELSDKGAHTITITCDQSFVPDEVSHSGDTRRLSIIVQKLCCSLVPQ